MGIVVRFDGPRIRRENAEAIANKTDAQLDTEFLRIVTVNAWSEFQVATRALVEAQKAMHEAHNKWLNYDMKLFAANAAEKLKP